MQCKNVYTSVYNHIDIHELIKVTSIIGSRSLDKASRISNNYVKN